MKNFNLKPLSFSVLALAGLITVDANAAQFGCATCGGYFYTQFSETSSYGMTISYQYNYVGPFADEESCQLAVNDDYGNNDGWLPFVGSPVCKYRFETDYGAYDEVLDVWNTVSPPTVGGGSVILNERLIREIGELRNQYNVPAYERAVISKITDPEIEG